MTTAVSPPEPAPDLAPTKVDDPAPLRAVHTTSFPALLRQLGASLLVTTDQAGKLVLVRDEGDHLNTHSRAFPAPMGLALRVCSGRASGERQPPVFEGRRSPDRGRTPPARPDRPLREQTLTPLVALVADPLGRGPAGTPARCGGVQRGVSRSTIVDNARRGRAGGDPARPPVGIRSARPSGVASGRPRTAP